MRLLLLAPPGAGKGTQAHRLAERYGIEHISTGDLLRREAAAGTAFGLHAKEYLDRGDLVPDELIRDMVVNRLIAADARGGFLLDGYPRNRSQAEAAQRLAAEQGITVNGVIYLEVSHEVSLRRLLSRAGEQARSDDQAETIRHRLDVFDQMTRPLADYFRERGLLIAIDGEQPVDKVTEDILARVEAVGAGGATPSAGPDRPEPGDGSR